MSGPDLGINCLQRLLADYNIVQLFLTRFPTGRFE